jgi:hypothetical protein
VRGGHGARQGRRDDGDVVIVGVLAEASAESVALSMTVIPTAFVVMRLRRYDYSSCQSSRMLACIYKST